LPSDQAASTGLPTGSRAPGPETSLEGQERVDPHRPQFHLAPPSGWLNDPNGVGQWDGRYHLFYQHNPDAPVHAQMHWGHASSLDLVHWQDEPIALTPSAGPDADGCWSGVLVDDGGTPTLVYSGHRDGVGQRACLAVGDPELRVWRKDPGNPVIADLPDDLDLVEFRDHCVWRAGDGWLQLVGSGIRGKGGTALLYRSPDLRSWTYVGPILVGNATDREVWTGSVWECVDLFRLGADDHPSPDVLLLSVWEADVTHHGVYQTGRFDGERFHLAQRRHLDYGLNYFYAAQSFADDRGRRIMFGWLQEGRPIPAQIDAGWSGVMSLPRLVTLTAEGQVHQQPVEEVSRLRRDHVRVRPATPQPDHVRLLPEISGDQLDLELTVALGCGATLELGVLATPDQAEQTVVRLAADSAGVVRLSLDRSAGSLDASVDTRELGGVIPVEEDGPVALRVIVDHSAVEIFANGRPLTARVYPTRADARGVQLLVRGDVRLESFDAWRMDGIWSGPRSIRR
jgi:beta-fructofuranosidase